MADVAVTAADVQKKDGAVVKQGTAGAAIEAGDAIFIDPADDLVKLASNAGEGSSMCDGIALSDAASGQPVFYASEGPIDIGATLVVGEFYVLSAAGAISPVGDAVSTDWMTGIGFATAADNLVLNIDPSGVQAA